MRYLLLLLALAGCQPAIAAPPSKETIVEALERYHKLTDGKVDTLATKVDGLAETVGNGVAEQEATKEEVKALRTDVAEIKSLLTLPNEIAVPVPPAADPPPPVKVDAPPMEAFGRRVTFQGKPIDVQAWLRTPLSDRQRIGVGERDTASRSTVIEHLRYHKLDGNFDGLSREQLITLHSVAHLKEDAKPAKSVVMNAAVVIPQAGGCANGQCNRPTTWTYQTRRRYR